MSFKTVVLSSNPIPPNATSFAYVAALYLLMGIILLSAFVLRTIFFKSIVIVYVMISSVFLLSLTGLILSKFPRGRGTINQSKFVSFFALIMSSMVLQAGALVAVQVGYSKLRRRTADEFLMASLISGIVSLVLLGTSCILILFFNSKQEYNNFPNFSPYSKFLVGISGILASGCCIASAFFSMDGRPTELVLVVHYIQLAMVSFIGVGIVVGIVIAIVQYRQSAKNLPIVINNAITDASASAVSIA